MNSAPLSEPFTGEHDIGRVFGTRVKRRENMRMDVMTSGLGVDPVGCHISNILCVDTTRSLQSRPVMRNSINLTKTGGEVPVNHCRAQMLPKHPTR